MNSKKLSYAGWIVAACLVGVMFGSGFQGAADKTGTVDLNKAVQDSELGKKNREALDAAVNSRKAIIEFMQTRRVLTLEQAQKLKTLSIKSPLTDAEKKDLDKVKDDVISASKNFDALNQKPNPTEEDRNLLQEYNSRIQNTGGLIQDWGNQFSQELEQLQNQMISDSVKKADVAIKEVAKRDGYTVVFSSPGAAVYGANDLTEAVTKALNAQK